MKNIAWLRRSCLKGFFTKWFPLASGDFTFRWMTREEARDSRCAARSGSSGQHDLAARSSEPKVWHFRHLGVAMSISLLLQITFLPCLCWKGAVKLDLAWMLDLLVLIRIVIAFLARERGRGWMIYAGLLYTSPFWIGVLVEWALAK